MYIDVLVSVSVPSRRESSTGLKDSSGSYDFKSCKYLSTYSESKHDIGIINKGVRITATLLRITVQLVGYGCFDNKQ